MSTLGHPYHESVNQVRMAPSLEDNILLQYIYFLTFLGVDRCAVFAWDTFLELELQVEFGLLELCATAALLSAYTCAAVRAPVFLLCCWACSRTRWELINSVELCVPKMVWNWSTVVKWWKFSKFLFKYFYHISLQTCF